MKKTVYFDNAATTRVHPDVLSAMIPYFCDEYANPSGAYKTAANAERAVNRARIQAAGLIGARPNEIYFTSGGSESDNWAIKGYSREIRKKRQGASCHIITSSIEHNAVINSCRSLEAEGFAVTYLPCDSQGFVHPEAVLSALREDTILISVMTANNEVGSVQPIKAIGQIAHRHQIVFHTDAVQACGHIPISVNDCMIDMMSVSAHKFHGPKGVGFLYIRTGLEFPGYIDGGSQENGHRAGTSNVPGIVGLGKACEISRRNMQKNINSMILLRGRIIRRIKQGLPDAVLTGSEQMRLPNNISFCFPHVESSALLAILDSEGICASAGSACSTGAAGPSHVLIAMGISPDLAGGSLRLTISDETTAQEADFVADTVIRAVKKLQM
jgi:cysteine desulfurase